MAHYDSFRREDDRKNRRQTAENYEPIVLWVDTDRIEERGGRVDTEEAVRQYIMDTVRIPFVSISDGDEPWCEVVTEFDDDSVSPEEIR